MPHSQPAEPETVVGRSDIILVVMAFIMMLVTVGLLVFNSVQLAGSAQKADETHRAVCLYRAQLHEQARATAKYLAAHPGGAPALGISAAQLQRTENRQQAAAQSLADLHC